MMVTFLNPAGFWAFTALAVPIIVHLLHRGKRKHVLVGSVRFLKGRQTQTLAQIRLTERRLLALRLLVFSLLALLLTKPHLERSLSPLPATGWVLIDPRLAGVDFPDQETRLLEKAETKQWRISWLQEGFPDWSAADSAETTQKGSASLWSLASEAAWEFPDDGELHFLVTGHSSEFSGPKPTLIQENLGWHFLPKPPVPAQLESAIFFEPALLEVVLGRWVEGNWQRTRHQMTWKPSPQSFTLASGEKILVEGEGETLVCRLDSFEGNRAGVVAARANPAIYLLATNPAAEDVRLLKLAFEAVASYYGWPLKVEVVNPNQPPANPPALAFWLAGKEEQLPSAWLEQGSMVVFDAGDKPYSRQTGRIRMDAAFPANGPQLLRRVEPSLKGEVCWTDEWNVPLLEVEKQGNGTVFRLATRFLPEWTSLVQDESLPLWLAELLESQWRIPESGAVALAPVAMDPMQTQPYFKGSEGKTSETVKASLSLPLWLAALGLFCMERWWASKRREA